MNQAAVVLPDPPMTLQHYFISAGVRENLPFARAITMSPDMVPMKHQVSGLNQVLVHDRFGLYDMVGTGKSLIMQAAALYFAGHKNKVVILMPPVLLRQFENALDDTFYGWRDYFSYHVLKEGPAGRTKLFKQWRAGEWPDMIAMSYQQFAKLPRGKKNKEGDTIPPNPDDFIAGVLKKAGYTYIIADEAHALKSSSSQQHRAVKHLAEDGGLLMATGTPTPNTLMDAYGMISLITPDKYASKKTFERLHCIYTTSGNGWSTLLGFQNKAVLSTHLYSSARRVTKEQVLSLDKPQVIEIPINLDPVHYRLYKKLIKERILEIEEGEIITALTQQALRMKSLQIITTPDFFTNKTIKNEVLAGTAAIMDSIGMYDNKVLVFANFQRSVEMLANSFREGGLNPAVVYGGPGNNALEVEKFLTDDTCRVMVANPESGGAGLNLQSVCSNVIFVEPTSVPGRFTQAANRVHRPGQTKVVTIYILKALGTVAPNMTKKMLNKEGDTKLVMRDKESMLDELMGGT